MLLRMWQKWRMPGQQAAVALIHQKSYGRDLKEHIPFQAMAMSRNVVLQHGAGKGNVPRYFLGKGGREIVSGRRRKYV
jgi:hypothetical protein